MKYANKELSAMSVPQLVVAYNSLVAADKATKRFSDHATALKRTIAANAAHKGAAPTPSPVRIDNRAAVPAAAKALAAKKTAKVPAKPAKKTAKVPAKPAKKTAKVKTESTVSADREETKAAYRARKITILVEGNPKRGTAATRYDLYKNNMSVEKYLSLGGQLRDVNWDAKMGWISAE